MRLSDKLSVVEEVDSQGLKFVRMLAITLFVMMVVWKFIASLFGMIDWALLVDLLPDWLVPDVLSAGVKDVPAVPIETSCKKMPDGILICDDGVHLPQDGKGDQK